jgi:uncharacterized membrane protein (Fun14 family)
MTSTTTSKSPATGSSGYQWHPWKIGAVIFAGVLILAGGAFALFADEPEKAEISTRSGAASELPGTRSFAPGSSGGTTSTDVPADAVSDGEGDDIWSPALLRGGISFFAAFVLAFALRSFLRLAMIFAGVWVASLFLLASLGWIEVHWTVIDDQFVGWTQTLGAQFQSLAGFVTGSLPKAGMAGLGLVAGFKKG